MGDDTIRDKAEEWKGEAKETVGDAPDNKDLEAERAMEQANAKAKQGVQSAKEDLRDSGEGATRRGSER